MNTESLLKSFTDEQLKDELTRRSVERRARKLLEKRTRVSCDNCRNRIRGFNSKSAYYVTWVCRLRPKGGLINQTHAEPQQVYFSCCARFTNNCDLFRKKDDRP